MLVTDVSKVSVSKADSRAAAAAAAAASAVAAAAAAAGRMSDDCNVDFTDLDICDGAAPALQAVSCGWGAAAAAARLWACPSTWGARWGGTSFVGWLSDATRRCCLALEDLFRLTSILT